MGTANSTTRDEKGNGVYYPEGVNATENNDENAKTVEAFFKLTGCGGVEIDEKAAVALLEEQAESGDNEAMWMLGLCCEYGIGTEQDFEPATLFYRKSCEGGNVVGEFLLKNDQGRRGSGVMKVSLSLLNKWRMFDDSFLSQFKRGD